MHLLRAAERLYTQASDNVNKDLCDLPFARRKLLVRTGRVKETGDTPRGVHRVIRDAMQGRVNKVTKFRIPKEASLDLAVFMAEADFSDDEEFWMDTGMEDLDAIRRVVKARANRAKYHQRVKRQKNKSKRKGSKQSAGDGIETVLVSGTECLEKVCSSDEGTSSVTRNVSSGASKLGETSGQSQDFTKSAGTEPSSIEGEDPLPDSTIKECKFCYNNMFTGTSLPPCPPPGSGIRDGPHAAYKLFKCCFPVVKDMEYCSKHASLNVVVTKTNFWASQGFDFLE
jgi:hypothetical protein